MIRPKADGPDSRSQQAACLPRSRDTIKPEFLEPAGVGGTQVSPTFRGVNKVFWRPLRVPLHTVAVCALLACGGNDSGDFGDEIGHAHLDPDPVIAKVLSAAPVLGRPLGMRVSNGLLWVADGAGDPGLHVLNATTGDLIYSMGRRGEGPGEFGDAPSSLEVFSEDPGSVWTWDMLLQRLMRFEPQPISEYEIQVLTLIGPRVRRLVWPEPDRLIGISMSEEERFSFFSPNGDFQHSKSGPILGTDDIPMRARLNATDGPSKTCTWPGRGFAILNFFVGRLEFYDVEAELVRLAEVPFESSVLFEAMDGGRVRHLIPRAWYYDCAATNTTLFALFSGRLRSAFEGDARFSGRYVHMFNWSGKLLGVLELDRDIRSIAINERGTTLFAASLVDSKIYAYDISDLHR